LVAGKLTEKYYRPVLVIVKTEEKAKGEDGKEYILYKGSGRSIEEFNMVASLEDCKDHLYKYGGHPMAGGFSTQGEEQTNKFIEKIKGLADETLKNSELLPKIKIDCEIDFSDIDEKTVEMINNLGPFGQNNPTPRFCSELNVKVISMYRDTVKLLLIQNELFVLFNKYFTYKKTKQELILFFDSEKNRFIERSPVNPQIYLWVYL
jgi:single-stranded-DNA-specific exonuclease